MKLIKILTSTLVLTMWCVSAFAASVTETYGFSPQGIALGNAMTARVNDWSSVFYNMAGLGRTTQLKGASAAPVSSSNDSGDGLSLKKKEEAPAAAATEERAFVNDLAVSYFRTMPSLKLKINRKDLSGNKISTLGADIDSYGYAILGLAVDLNYIYKMPSIVSSARLGVGAAANDDLSAAKLNDVDPRTHNFVCYGREAQMAAIMAGAGFGFLNDAFGIGVGARVSFSGEGVVTMEGVGMKSTSQNPYSQTKMDLSISPSLMAGAYFSPGKFVPIINGLDIGVSYRQESFMEINPFDATARAMDGSVNMRMIMGILDYYTPHTMTLGISYSIWKLTVSADIEYQMYSKFKTNSANQYWHTDDKGTETDSSDDDVNIAGTMPKMKDILVYRLGVEFRVLSSVSLMCGAYYQPYFIPDNALTGDINLLDNDKYVGSAGATIKLPRMMGFGGPVDLTVAYQMQYLKDRKVVKSSSANFTNTYNPNYTFGGTNHSIIAGLVLKL